MKRYYGCGINNRNQLQLLNFEYNSRRLDKHSYFVRCFLPIQLEILERNEQVVKVVASNDTDFAFVFLLTSHHRVLVVGGSEHHRNGGFVLFDSERKRKEGSQSVLDDRNANVLYLEECFKSLLEDGDVVKDVAIGYSHVLFVTRQSKLFSLGVNWYGELGIGVSQRMSCDKPQPVKILDEVMEISQIVCGSLFCMVLLKDGRIFSWGSNNFGQLGVGDTVDRYVPSQIDSFVSEQDEITLIRCGNFHSIFLSRYGQLYATGSNSKGQLCIPEVSRTTEVPLPVPNFTQDPILDVQCGLLFTIILTTKGDVYCCGDSEFGEMGIGKATFITRPIKLNLPSAISQIACSCYHSVFVSKDDVLVCGENTFGQLATHDNVRSLSPQQISLPSMDSRHFTIWCSLCYEGTFLLPNQNKTETQFFCNLFQHIHPCNPLLDIEFIHTSS